MAPARTLVPYRRSGAPPSHSWIPQENQAAVSSSGYGCPDPSSPTGVYIGRGYNQQLYVCPAAPEHPHAEWMQ